MHVCGLCRCSHKGCVQIPEHPYKENNPEQRREMAKYYMEMIQEEKHL